MTKKRNYQHHIRLRLALNVEFQEDNRAESHTVWVTDQALQLSDLLAACITGLLIWLQSLPAWWAVRTQRARQNWRAWAADLAVMRTALETITWADLSTGWGRDLAVIRAAFSPGIGPGVA